jgi:predicted Zn-dependent protease
MKTKLLSFFALCLFFAACSGTKKTIIVKPVTVSSQISNDGSSYEKAIFIKETSEKTGVTAEYSWLRDKYPGYKSNGQALQYHDKRPYDIIHIITSDGKPMDVYFDISGFYGKF